MTLRLVRMPSSEWFSEVRVSKNRDDAKERAECLHQFRSCLRQLRGWRRALELRRLRVCLMRQVCLCIHTCLHVGMHACVHACVCVCACVHLCVCVCVHACVHACVIARCLRARTYSRACTHTRTHARTHRRTPASICRCLAHWFCVCACT